MSALGHQEFIIALPLEGALVPSSNAVMMLLRASRNIVASMRQREVGFAYEDAQLAIFCAFTIQLLLNPEPDEPLSLLRATGALPSMECYTLSTALVPLLENPRREALEDYCRGALAHEEREAFATAPKLRTDANVKHFIGQVLRHTELEYYGCIIGWDVGILLRLLMLSFG